MLYGDLDLHHALCKLKTHRTKFLEKNQRERGCMVYDTLRVDTSIGGSTSLDAGGEVRC